jgi:hypothetical protein
LSGGHFPALIGALPACFRTTLAMVHLMHGALFAALFADLRTQTAKPAGEFFISETGASGHKRRSQPANIRAIPVKLNTFHHRPHVNFSQTS